MNLAALNEAVFRRLGLPDVRALGQHFSEYRIAFYVPGEDGLRVLTPDARFMKALMHGGIVHRMRVSHDEDGKPVFEGSGEPLGPLTEREAVEFIAWKDLPRGVNHYEIITTDDLPRINGSIDAARAFRNTWRLN